MPAKRDLELGEVEEETLEAMRDYHPKAYMRERAAALLKIAQGYSVNWVAQYGLLKERRWETVASWLNKYLETGLGGLYLESGRGRKAAYDP